jgi:hypothetical protein
VAEDRDPVRRRRDALRGDVGPEQCVDERALARVELPHYDQQEELFEVRGSLPHEIRILRRRPEGPQELLQPCKELPLPDQQRLPTLVQDLHHTSLPRLL